jgi:hypothetical protein
MANALDIFTFLRSKSLGAALRVQTSSGVEDVVLVRRGRQKIRVRRREDDPEAKDKQFLVELDDVQLD